MTNATSSRVRERQRAAALARHYREQEHLPISEIAERLGRKPATINAYLYDPTAAKTKQVKSRYRGVCHDCGAPTWGSGPGHAAKLCARCNGQATRKWQPERIEAALRAWKAMYGREPRTTDLSLTHARKAAMKGDEKRLRRLQHGWSGGHWPPASVIQYNYGSVANANDIAFGRTHTAGAKPS
jgi:IS30 family transposase